MHFLPSGGGVCTRGTLRLQLFSTEFWSNGGDIFGKGQKRAPQGHFSTFFRDTPLPEGYRGDFAQYLTKNRIFPILAFWPKIAIFYNFFPPPDFPQCRVEVPGSHTDPRPRPAEIHQNMIANERPETDLHFLIAITSILGPHDLARISRKFPGKPRKSPKNPKIPPSGGGGSPGSHFLDFFAPILY